MARIAAVFQVWLVATGTTMGTSTMKATSVISGRLRQSEQTLGTVTEWWYTEVSRDTATNDTVFSSLRSGLKTRACGGLDPLIL